MNTIPEDSQTATPRRPATGLEGPRPAVTDAPAPAAASPEEIPLLAADIGLELIDDEPAALPAESASSGVPCLAQAPGGPTEPDGALLDRIFEQVCQHQQQLQELREEFQSKLKYDSHKEKIIDSLHKELQEYKHDFVKKHLLSVLMDVIKIIDDIRKWVHHYRVQDPATRDTLKLFKYLESIPSDLEDIFYWQGVKAFTCSGEEFDPVRQRAVKKIDTSDPAQDKLVAESLRSGYEWEGKIIRPEMVAVFQYKEPLVESEARGTHE
jgi:molecular chaperone GrpE (heat shock protein)